MNTSNSASNPLQLGGYQLFEVSLASELALPELRRSSAAPDIVVRQLAVNPVEPGLFDVCHEWRSDAGQLICRCARRGRDYLLSFPQQADFHVGADGVINAVPAPGVDQGLLRHLLLNQVLPRYLAHTGELLLHASAVTLANGHTVAFLGDSGFGKSTLASYCHAHSAQLVDDDCILLRSTSEGTSITGGVPTLRLYPDSIHALGYDAALFSPYVDTSRKLQMCLPDRAAAHPRVLDSLFVLGAPSEAPVNDTVVIAPAGGQKAMMPLLAAAFNLDPTSRSSLSHTFEHVAQLLGGGLPVYHLNYCRDHLVLPNVLQALLAGSYREVGQRQQ